MSRWPTQLSLKDSLDVVVMVFTLLQDRVVTVDANNCIFAAKAAGSISTSTQEFTVLGGGGGGWLQLQLCCRIEWLRSQETVTLCQRLVGQFLFGVCFDNRIATTKLV